MSDRDQLAALIDQHLAHRNPADRLCRDQLIASIEQLFAASEAEVTRLETGIAEALAMFDTRFTDEPDGFGSEVSPLVPLRYHLERLSQPTTDTNGEKA